MRTDNNYQHLLFAVCFGVGINFFPLPSRNLIEIMEKSFAFQILLEKIDLKLLFSLLANSIWKENLKDLFGLV